MQTYNWQVRCYDETGSEISNFVIKDKTEADALKEAENHHTVVNADDWTMTKIV